MVKKRKFRDFRRNMARTLNAIARYSLFPGQPLLNALAALLENPDEMDIKIKQAMESLRNTNELLHQLESSIDKRTEQLELLKSKYDEYSKLASTELEKADPIIQEMRKYIKKDRPYNVIVAFIVGLSVFIVGVIIGPYLTFIKL